MAINLLCPACKSTLKLEAAKCHKCSTSLTGSKRRYRVRVKRKDGTWKSKVTKNLKTARDLESKWTYQDAMGIPDQDDSSEIPTFAGLWKAFSKWAEHNKSSYDSDSGRYQNHIKDAIGSKRVNTIAPTHIDVILIKMKQRGYAPQTVLHVLNLIRRVFNWAAERKLYLGANPAAGIKLPTFDNMVTGWMPKDDLTRLLDTLDSYGNERAALVIKYAIASGRRRGEILSLKWQYITKEFTMVEYHGDYSKNGEKNVLPLNQICQAILRRAWDIRLSDYVFPCSTGKHYESFSKTWQRIRVKAGIDFRFHDLRHTFASYLASTGQVDIYTLQKLLGHKNITMTQRYAHLINSALSRGAAVADAEFNIQVPGA